MVYYEKSEDGTVKVIVKDGVYHCDMFTCPYRASFYCMMQCKGKKEEEK